MKDQENSKEKFTMRKGKAGNMKCLGEDYHSIFDAANDGIFVHDVDTGEIIDINRKACEMFGYSKENIPRTAFFEGEGHLPYADKESLHYFRKATAGRPQLFERVAKDKNGQMFWAEVSLKRVLIGSNTRLLAFVRDITRQKSAEEALKESEELYRTIFENTGAATVIVEEDGTVSLANSECERLSGYTREEIEGKKKWTEFVLKEDLDELLKRFRIRKSDRDAVPKKYEFRFIDRQGRVKDIFLSIDVIPGTKKSVASLWDITGRKHAEDLTRKSEEKYRELVENANSIILRMDNSGNVTYINEFAQRFFGYAEEDILGKNVVGTIVPEKESTGRDLKWLIEDIARRPDRYTNNVNENMRRNSENIWISWTNKPIRDERGRVVETLCIGNDITERKRAEDALRKSEREKSAILDAMSEIVIFLDKDMKVVWSNSAMNRQFNMQPGQIEGRYCYEALHGLNRPCRICPAVKVIETGKPHAIDDFSSLGKRWTMRAYPVREDEGNIVGIVEIVTDITERKKAEEALIKSESQLRRVTDNMVDLVLQIDVQAVFQYLSPNVTRLFGYSIEALLGKSAFDFLHPDDRYAAIGAFQGALKTGSGSVEVRIRHKSGHYMWMELLGNAVTGEGGKIDGIIVGCRDITRRKRTEEALRESQQRLADIINFLPDATLVIDREGRVIAWNRAIAAMTGVKAGDMVDKGDYEYSIPFYGERRPILIDLALHGDRTMDPLYTTIQRQEDIFFGESYTPALYQDEDAYLSATASVLRDSRGEIVGAIECIRDITEHRRTAQALSAEHDRLSSILDGIPIPTFVIDRNRTIVLWNRSNEIFTGKAKEEMLGKELDLGFLFTGETPPTLAELVLEMTDDEIMQKVGSKGVHKSDVFPGAFEGIGMIWLRGEERIMSIQAARIYNPHGEVIGAVQTGQDITERVRAQEEREKLQAQLIQAQKMDAVGTLAGGIAHDFNNILAAIMGYTEIAKNRLQQEELVPYLKKVLDASVRAKDLIGQILTFSRQKDREMKPVDVVPLIKEALKLLRAAIPSTIEIRHELGTGAYVVLADSTQIHQVVINLCTNATHAMRDRGGVLGVKLDKVEITAQNGDLYPDLHPGLYAELTVSDMGTGIEPKIMHRIFDPFFTTKEQGEGTGLGLSVVYGIVKSYGGMVTVRSELGTGSVFRIYLPVIDREVPLQSDSVGVIPRGSERILLVDDEEDLSEMCREILEGLGYRVISTTDSIKALEIFQPRSERFDLIITDMTMPGMTGVDLAEELLRIRPDIPIILCTGDEAVIKKEDMKKTGIHDFILKPFSVERIAQAVRRVLDESRNPTKTIS